MFRRMTVLLVATGAIATIGVVLVASSGSAQPSGGQTLVFSGGKGSFASVDNPPKGRSSGDIDVFARPFTDGQGQRVGRAQFACIAVTAHGVDQCTGTLTLDDGEIVAAGAVGQTDKATFAVVGGTGTYEGARGSWTNQMLKNGGSTLTIHLLSP